MKGLSRLHGTLIILSLFIALGCSLKRPDVSPPREEPHAALPPQAGSPQAPSPPRAEPEPKPPENPVPSPPPVEQLPVAAVPQATTPDPQPEPASEAQEPGEPVEKTDQEILDSALEFLQDSYEFWEKGEFERAIEALDEAYALILTVDGAQNASIQQQKEDLRITISRRIVECYTSRFRMANGRHNAIPLVSNIHVEKALALFTGKEKGFFLDAYRRSGRYRPGIVEALREAGLPEELSWLPLIESGFQARALSRARALGIWQFIASTGYKFGLKRDRYVDERMDPEKSTRAAIAYLKELHQIFGDWTTVLAAYNCGEWTVLKAIRSQRINYLDNFWDLYERLPAETAFYVPKFLAVLHILNDPARYGITLPEPDPAIVTAQVSLQKPVHLREIAKRIDVSYDDLSDLNPELRLDATPPSVYGLRVPEEKAGHLKEQLDTLPLYTPPSPAYVVHRVVSGETLSTIANRYRTSVRAIMAMNNLSSGHFVRAGWKLKIPTGRSAVVPMEKKAGAPDAAKGGLTKYTVEQGDSLWDIAVRHGTSVKAVQTLNSLEGSRLRVGQVLMLPSGSLSPPPGLKTKPYKVLDGDSPYVIAQKHQMTLSEFLRLNDLTPRSRIFPGQTVFVKTE